MKNRRKLVVLRVASALGRALPALASAPAAAQDGLRLRNDRRAATELRDALGNIERALGELERTANIEARYSCQRPDEDVDSGPARLGRATEPTRAARGEGAGPEHGTVWRKGQRRAPAHSDNANCSAEPPGLEPGRRPERDRDQDRGREFVLRGPTLCGCAPKTFRARVLFANLPNQLQRTEK